jgi:CII-binding regulator of phage lambda lysogenization HflD
MEVLVVSLISVTILIHVFAIKHFTKLYKCLVSIIEIEKKLNEKTSEVLSITFKENQSLKNQLQNYKTENYNLKKRLKSINDKIDSFTKVFDN